VHDIAQALAWAQITIKSRSQFLRIGQWKQLHRVNADGLAAASAADAFALAHCVRSRSNCQFLRVGQLQRSCISCRCLRIGPLHAQLQLLPIPLRWSVAYATTEAADAFELARCICSRRNCQFLCIGQLNTQPHQLPIPSRWPIAASTGADAFPLAHVV